MDTRRRHNDEISRNEIFSPNSMRRNSSNRCKILFECFQYFVPRQTMIYIRYCLLRVPFLLLYDYLFTEQFSLLFQNFLSYLIQFMNNENYLLFKVTSFILHNHVFQFFFYFHLSISIPLLGNISFIKNRQKEKKNEFSSFLGLILLTVLLLCSDRRLEIFYSYIISLFVLYFYYQTNRLADTNIRIFVLQTVLSSIYLQMINLYYYVYTIQKSLCQLAPFLFLITRHFLSIKNSMYILKIYYLLWILINLIELFISQRKLIRNLMNRRFLNELIHSCRNLNTQRLFNYLQQQIQINQLLKIFWFTKIIVLPLSIRIIYTNSSITDSMINNNSRINIHMTNTTTINYNETLTKTIYYAILFYGTETLFT